MLARADLEIAQAYNVLAPTPLHRFFAEIRREYAAAREHVLEVKDCTALLDCDPTLQRALQLRNPYVDPMNLMQVDLLRRWRASGREDRDLFRGAACEHRRHRAGPAEHGLTRMSGSSACVRPPSMKSALILSFIRELAEYEHLAHEVVATEERCAGALWAAAASRKSCSPV